MISFLDPRCCLSCHAPCSGNFRKVFELKDSQLHIYKINKNKTADERIILHNTGCTEITKPEIMNELNRFNQKCYLCKLFFQQVCDLLSNIAIINVWEIRSICKYCKDINTTNQCKRCNYVVRNFLQEQKGNIDHNKQCTEMLTQIRTMLENIEICKKEMIPQSSSLDDLLRMIEKKKKASVLHEKKAVKLTDFENLRFQSEQEDLRILKEAICYTTKGKQTISAVPNTSLSLESDTQVTCVCKYLAKKLATKQLPNNNIKVKSLPSTDVTSSNNLKKTVKAKEGTKEKITQLKEKKIMNKKKDNKIPGDTKLKAKIRKISKEEDSDTFLKMIMNQQKKRKPIEEKNLKKIEIDEISDLPPLPIKEFKEVVLEESGSIVECGDLNLTSPPDIIKGHTIVHHESKEKTLLHMLLKPLLFEVKHSFADLEYVSSSSTDLIDSPTFSNHRRDIEMKIAGKRLNKYQLSNEEYIKNGWTALPELKVMREINIYKMVPAEPKLHWFQYHKNQRQMYYDTGELLAEITEEGYGSWYYKDGCVALNFRESTDSKIKIYCVYDMFSKKKNGSETDIPMLACFDFIGHGIVYDRFGRTRIKYDQSDGIVIDKQIGPPAVWKWHDLNDPPVVMDVFHENYLSPHDKCLDNLHSVIEMKNSSFWDKRYEIELTNRIREKAQKLSMAYKPFEIRFKVFKLNEYFSLKILNQTKIYLMFRDGKISLKLNVGLKLLTNEIIGVETVHVPDVVNDYERWKLDNPLKI